MVPKTVLYEVKSLTYPDTVYSARIGYIADETITDVMKFYRYRSGGIMLTEMLLPINRILRINVLEKASDINIEELLNFNNGGMMIKAISGDNHIPGFYVHNENAKSTGLATIFHRQHFEIGTDAHLKYSKKQTVHINSKDLRLYTLKKSRELYNHEPE